MREREEELGAGSASARASTMPERWARTYLAYFQAARRSKSSPLISPQGREENKKSERRKIKDEGNK